MQLELIDATRRAQVARHPRVANTARGASDTRAPCLPLTLMSGLTESQLLEQEPLLRAEDVENTPVYPTIHAIRLVGRVRSCD